VPARRTFAVAAEATDRDSTLAFYRRALELRRALQPDEAFEWLQTDDPVVGFRRADGWASFTNFGSEAVARPAGTVIIASAELLQPAALPADTTVWLRLPGS